MTNVEGRLLWLMLCDEDGNWHKIDSCEVMHGVFEMWAEADSVVIATLFVDDQPLMPVILQPGNLHVTIDDLNLQAHGTKLNDKLYTFIKSKNKLDVELSELGHKESQMIMNGVPDDYISKYIDSTYNVISCSMNQLVTEFITTNFDNVLSLCGFSMLSNGLPYPVITPLIQEVLDAAPQSFKDYPLISSFVKAAGDNVSNPDASL